MVQYAFKKETRGERHGSAAERLLAGSNPDRAQFAAMMSALPPPPPVSGVQPMMQSGMMGIPMMQPGMIRTAPMMQQSMMGAPMMPPGMMGGVPPRQ